MDIDKRIVAMIKDCEHSLKGRFEELEEICEYNQLKVLNAMHNNKLSEHHFYMSTGYGYNDQGREVCEKIYAEVFGAECALVRPQIVSGTHAIALCLYGVLRPGDEIISATGMPYDTIQTIIGEDKTYKGQGTLKEYDITFKTIELRNNGNINIENVVNNINNNTKAIYMQRSTGYEKRNAITISLIKQVVNKVKKSNNDIIIILDNCYGEFIEKFEPTEVGVDLIAGSLIKNPGGGLATTGGYVIGKEKYVKKAAARLSAPGIEFEVGANLGVIRSYLQGLFIAPSVTMNALKGAILTAAFFKQAGYDVFPDVGDLRSDIIQGIALGSKEKVISYCKAIQEASPVDSFAAPLPWDMPGYSDEIIMAAGNFIQGSSIELSADAPIREPYIVYQQGGLTYQHVKLGLANAYSAIEKFNKTHS
ncbi:MAG: aminotransferase class I/II-fold pyridoxal phosphate-dependent enzyme [Eubacteriales bacterium]